MNYKQCLEWTQLNDRMEQSRHRRLVLKSFGHNAVGILANTAHGPMVVDPEDSVVGYLLLNNGCYGVEELERAKAVTTKEGNVLIVGTHIGALAIPLSRVCKNLHAVEANPATFSHLVTNLRINECSNVTAYNVAANDKEEKLRFLMNRENSGGSKRFPVHVKPDYVYDRPLEVEMQAMRLDDLIKERNFDFCLMDIEGSEYFALKGMQEILRGIKAIAIEYYPFHIRDIAGVGIDDFLASILPHFNWLYVPGDAVYSGEDIRGKLTAMFNADEIHEGIYFFKELPEFLRQKQALPTA